MKAGTHSTRKMTNGNTNETHSKHNISVTKKESFSSSSSFGRRTGWNVIGDSSNILYIYFVQTIFKLIIDSRKLANLYTQILALLNNNLIFRRDFISICIYKMYGVRSICIVCPFRDFDRFALEYGYCLSKTVCSITLRDV